MEGVPVLATHTFGLSPHRLVGEIVQSVLPRPLVLRHDCCPSGSPKIVARARFSENTQLRLTPVCEEGIGNP